VAVSFAGPLPRRLSRLLSALILIAWPLQMGWLVYASYLRPGAALSGDLARYGSSAHWKGVYYRGEKIGFSVSETVPEGDGYELREDAHLYMALLGAPSARLRTTARVDRAFQLRSFTFSLDPGTGPMTIDGRLDGRRLDLAITSASGRRTETRNLAEVPSLSLNLPRRLAAAGLVPGQKSTVPVFDPVSLRNAPMTIEVQARELVWKSGRPIPAFRVQTTFSGVTAQSWITDVGEVVREESPTGFIVAEETRERATARAVSGDVQGSLLETVAIRPTLPRPIDDPRGVLFLRLRLDGAAIDPRDLEGVGQHVRGREIELRSSAEEALADPTADEYRAAEPFIESDAPEIQAEAQKAVAGITDPAARAERLTRYVNALLEKKPTVSLPSALEVLRTKVGDCNEHTALYVALARAAGLPARIAVGLVFVRGAFYYHAWPEVYVPRPGGGAGWLAVDPTLGQFPADATHVRIARGGLDRQAAVLPLIGRAKITVLELKMDPKYSRILVGAGDQNQAPQPFAVSLPSRTGGRTCWSRPGS
jgi:transglutaminase-like putative cysteine protease